MTIGTNMQVMHSFAHYGAEHKNQSGSVYIEGDTIYSYGSHFPMANRAHGDCFLVTTDTASVTTAKQMSYLWRALHGVRKVFNVMDVHATGAQCHADNFADYRERVENALGQAVRSRKYKESCLESAHRLAVEANDYAQRFIENPVYIDVSNFDLDSIKEKLAEQKRERAKAEKARKAQLAKDNAEKIERWRAGERVSLPHDIGPLLRIVERDRSKHGGHFATKFVETSWHAEFPAFMARACWLLVKRTMARGETWRPNGETIKLGVYSVDSIAPNGDIKAGCHLVKFSEVENCAKLLGLLDNASA